MLPISWGGARRSPNLHAARRSGGRSLAARPARRGRPAARSRRADLGLYGLCRSAAPAAWRVQAVRSFSRLGEHAAVWLALGPSPAPWTVRAARAGGAARRTVGAAYVANTALKAVVRRRRPALDGLPALIARRRC